MIQLLPKNSKEIDFLKFFVEITHKNDFILQKNVKTENDPQCL